MIKHSQLVAKVLRANLRGDSITLNRGTSDARTICGMLSYESVESAGAEVRNPIMRIAACEVEHVSHGTNVLLTSAIHGLDQVPAEVRQVEYLDAGTVNLYLLANV